jgi:N-acetyl-anhydromuramyl-L-alanine amidase AmpD
MELYYPNAIKSEAMKTRGNYSLNYPEGAIIHYTASASAIPTLSWGRQKGFCFFLIDKNGDIYQSFPINEWGDHAGQSKCPKTNREFVHRYYVGIEMVNCGELKLDKGIWRSWFGRIIQEKDVRVILKKVNEVMPGGYEKFTKEQEASLSDLLVWLYLQNPTVFSFDKVFGHNEVSPGRKVDPGGSISMSMSEYRAYLKNLASARSLLGASKKQST